MSSQRSSVTIDQKIVEILQSKVDGKLLAVGVAIDSIVKTIDERLAAEKKMSLDPLVPRVKRQVLATRHTELLEKFNLETERLQMLKEESLSRTRYFNNYKDKLRRATFSSLLKNEMTVTTQKEKAKLRVAGIFTERLVDSFYERDTPEESVEKNKILWRFQCLQRDLIGPGLAPNYMAFNIPDIYLLTFDLDVLIEVLMAIEALFHQRNVEEKLSGLKLHPFIYQRMCGILGFCLQLSNKLLFNSTKSYQPPPPCVDAKPPENSTTSSKVNSLNAGTTSSTTNSKNNAIRDPNAVAGARAKSPAGKAKNNGEAVWLLPSGVSVPARTVTLEDVRCRHHPDTVRLFLFQTTRTLNYLMSCPDLVSIILEDKIDANLAEETNAEIAAAEAFVESAFERKEKIVKCLCFLSGHLWGPTIKVDPTSSAMTIDATVEYAPEHMEADLLSLLELVYKYYVILFAPVPGVLASLRAKQREQMLRASEDEITDDVSAITNNFGGEPSVNRRTPKIIEIDLDERYRPMALEHIRHGSPLVTDLLQIAYAIIMKHSSWKNTRDLQLKQPGQGLFDSRSVRLKDGFMENSKSLFSVVPITYYAVELGIKSIEKLLVLQASEGNISYSDAAVLRTVDNEAEAGIKIAIAAISSGIIYPNVIYLLNEANALTSARKSCYSIQASLLYSYEVALLACMNFAETESELLKRLRLDLANSKVIYRQERRAAKIEKKRISLGIDISNTERIDALVVSDDDDPDGLRNPQMVASVYYKQKAIDLLEYFFPIEKSVPIKIGNEEMINSRQYLMNFLGPETLFYNFRIMSNFRNTFTIIHHGLIVCRLIMRVAFMKRLEIEYLFSMNSFEGPFISFAQSKLNGNDEEDAASAFETESGSVATTQSTGSKAAGINKQFDQWKKEAYAANLGPLMGLPSITILDLLMFILDNHFQCPEIVEQTLLLIQQLTAISNDIKIIMMDSDLKVTLNRLLNMFQNSIYITALTEICLDEMDFKNT